MAQHSYRRLPRGINFLLGGTAVALGVALLVLFGGSLDFGIGTAPQVRID